MSWQIILILALAILIFVILELAKIKKAAVILFGRVKRAGILNRLTKRFRSQAVNSWWSLEMPEVKVPTEILKLSGGKPAEDDVKRIKEIIEKTLKVFKVEIETVNEPVIGPTVTVYSFKPAAGVEAPAVPGLENEIASALLVHPVRIEAPIPGTDLIGIEVPNKNKVVVDLKEELETEEFKNIKDDLVVPFGRDMKYKQWNVSLSDSFHLLIGGSAGSGKSVFIHSLIISLMSRHSPSSLRFILADPKRVELSVYNDLPYLLAPAITGYQKAVSAFKWCLNEMDYRFKAFAQAKVHSLKEYNEGREEKMPYIIFIIDEMADFSMYDGKKTLEKKLIKLLKANGAAGIHLVISSQRPCDEVFSGALRENFPARLAFSTATKQDSGIILNLGGAEKLIGKGSALFMSAQTIQPVRLQTPYANDEIIKNAVNYIRSKSGNFKPIDVVDIALLKDDLAELLEEAKRLVIKNGEASTSLLQRKLQIGYVWASYLLNQLENLGIIGPFNGSDLREVFVTPEMYEKMGARAVLKNLNPELADDLLEEAKELVIKSGQASAAYLQRKLKIDYARSAKLLALMEEHGIIGPGSEPEPAVKKGGKIVSAGESSANRVAASKPDVKILHFEDDKFLSQMYGAKFKKGGFDYVSYDSPSDNPAEIVLKEKPDLIIMDIIMPVANGFTATEILKSDEKTRPIPILGLCNMSQKEDMDKAINLGMIDYFIKQHFIPSEIVNKVKEYLKDPEKYKPIYNS